MFQITGLLPPHEQLFRSLSARTELDAADREALAGLTYVVRTVPRGTGISEEGGERRHISLVLSGYAIRYRQTSDGGRQIISVDTAGNIIDPSYLYFDRCDQTVEALTVLEIADIAVADLQRVLEARPAILNALIIDSFIHASIAQQWLANIGGRSAQSRTAHLLCEFAVRVGRSGDDGIIEYVLPLTQTQLAEVLGLTLVHMNRTLKQLVLAGLIERKREQLRILDIAGLEAAADFSARYLHLERSSRDRRSAKR